MLELTLLNFFFKRTKYKIISIDNYSSGTKKNHIKSNRVKYLKGKTDSIFKLIKNPNQIKTVFHFGEFARIYQSFLKTKECIDSNTIGSSTVFNFCLKIKSNLSIPQLLLLLGIKVKIKIYHLIHFQKLKISNC